MRKLNNVWIRHHKISLAVRLKLYITYVKTVLLYNSSTWALAKADQESLDSFHRQQIRNLLHVKYPNILRNKDLYELINDIPLSLTVLINRWRLFGHVLRLHESTPARKAMEHYFSDSNSKMFPGSQRITLPVCLNSDIECAHDNLDIFNIASFKTRDDLQKLIDIANDRDRWKQLSRVIFVAAQAEKLM